MGRIGLDPGVYLLSSSEETFAFGLRVATSLPKSAVLALTGNLGAGKTTFVQGLGAGLGIQEVIQSPTFILLNVYEGLAHFDLYRIKSGGDFTALGFDEYFGKMMCAIEWPEKIQDILPKGHIRIHFEYQGKGRTATVS